MVGPFAHFAVSLDIDGKVVSKGPISDVLKENSAACSEAVSPSADKPSEEVGIAEGNNNLKKDISRPPGTLMMVEERAQGQLKRSASKFSHHSHHSVHCFVN